MWEEYCSLQKAPVVPSLLTFREKAREGKLVGARPFGVLQLRAEGQLVSRVEPSLSLPSAVHLDLLLSDGQ